MRLTHEMTLYTVLFAILTLLLGLFPDIDIATSMLFFKEGIGFHYSNLPLTKGLYYFVRIYSGIWMVGFAFYGIWLLYRSRTVLPIAQWITFLYLTMALIMGPLVAVHSGFKNHWGRPRPHQTILFHGEHPFVPSLIVLSDFCYENCSFVSGHASAGFALTCFALPTKRRAWLYGGIAVGLLFGAGRVIQGAHFLSDVLGAGAVVMGVTLLTWVAVQGTKPLLTRLLKRAIPFLVRKRARVVESL